MASPAAPFHVARQLEEGTAVAAAAPLSALTIEISDEKVGSQEDAGASALGSASTFTSQKTAGGNSSKSILTKATTWVTDAGSKLKPHTSGKKPKVKVFNLESFPEGYPRVSRYLESDDQFTMYRRFGLLHSRLLLHKQDEIREMEEELLTMDKSDEKSAEGRACLKCREDDDARAKPRRGRTRTELLRCLETKVLEYGRLLMQAQQLTSLNRPSDTEHRSVVNFIENEQPLMENDRDFIYHKEDLVSLRAGRENAWLDACVERVLRWFPCKPVKWLFTSEEDRLKTTDESIHYFSRTRINLCVTLIITSIILALLIVPVWLLYYLTVDCNTHTTDTVCIGVLLVSTLAFSCVLSAFTKAKRHETLAAAAGYCAVLVVFLGNVGNISGSGH